MQNTQISKFQTLANADDNQPIFRPQQSPTDVPTTTVEAYKYETPECESELPLKSESFSDIESVILQDKVKRLQHIRKASEVVEVRKSKSPSIKVKINDVVGTAVIDEGSEINCLDYQFATKNDIQFVPTDCIAQAAGSTNMKLAGETKKEMNMQVVGTVWPIVLNLGKMIVVANLGVDVLMGEPGKSTMK